MSDEPFDGQISRDHRSSNFTLQTATAARPVPAVAPGDDTHASTPADAQARLQFAEATHQYIRSYISLADQKATFFFTGATALLAFLYRIDVSGRWLKPVMLWNIIDTFAFIAMVTLALGALAALLVIVPQTTGSRRGFIFWDAIAEYGTGRQFAHELSALSPASLFQVKAEHCYDLAAACRRKHRYLRWAVWICGVGLAASLVVFLTSVRGRPASEQSPLSPSVVGTATIP